MGSFISMTGGLLMRAGRSSLLAALLAVCLNGATVVNDKAAGALLLAWSVGATIGPAVAGVAMERLGPAGLFMYLVAIFAGMALFTAWRMMLRGEPPRERRTAFVPAPTPPARLPANTDA